MSGELSPVSPFGAVGEILFPSEDLRARAQARRRGRGRLDGRMEGCEGLLSFKSFQPHRDHRALRASFSLLPVK